MCLSVTALAATCLVYMSKVARYTVSCKDLYCVDFAEMVLFRRYGTVFLPQ